MSIISKLLYRTIIGCEGVVERKFNKETKNFKKVNDDLLFDILSKNASSLILRGEYLFVQQLQVE